MMAFMQQSLLSKVVNTSSTGSKTTTRAQEAIKISMLVAVTSVSLLGPSDMVLELAFILCGAGLVCATVWFQQDSSSQRSPKALVSKDNKICKIINIAKKGKNVGENTGLDEKKAFPELPEVSSAYTFNTEDFDSQVQELVPQLTPPAASLEAASFLVEEVRRGIRKAAPNAEVVSIVGGNPWRGTRRIVSVPEIDIVAVVDGRLVSPVGQRSEEQQVKGMLRQCTNCLVREGSGFRFRRSAFKGPEPKVTLLGQLPNHIAGDAENVALDLSVNSCMPLYGAALVAEMEQYPGLKDLLLLVKFWAKARGICHASAGHLPPYGWVLLTVYFTQVGINEARCRMKPLGKVRLSPPNGGAAPTLEKEGGEAPAESPCMTDGAEPTGPVNVANLFKEFISFYANLDWRVEGVSVRTACRETPLSTLCVSGESGPKKLFRHEDAKPVEGDSASRLVIEDPFKSLDIGACLSTWGTQRLHEEFKRAEEMLSDGAPLDALSESWEPPERTKQDQE